MSGLDSEFGIWAILSAAAAAAIVLRCVSPSNQVPNMVWAHLAIAGIGASLLSGLLAQAAVVTASAGLLLICDPAPVKRVTRAQIGVTLEAILESSLLGGSAWHTMMRQRAAFGPNVERCLTPLYDVHLRGSSKERCLEEMRRRKAPPEFLNIAQLCLGAAEFGISFPKGLAQLTERWRQGALLAHENEATVAPFMWVNHGFAAVQVVITSTLLASNKTFSRFMLDSSLGHIALAYVACTTALTLALPAAMKHWRDA